jgi:hypothetical protein
MMVETKYGDTTYSLISLSYFNFISATMAIPQNTLQVSNVNLFPDPVITEFNISYQSEATAALLLEIIDMQGKVVRQQILQVQSGKNLFTIDATNLPSGLYICRFINSSSFENIKFIKN